MKEIKTKKIFIGVYIFLLSVTVSKFSFAQTSRPNFFIILTDDMVYHSLSGNTDDSNIQTPNIDRIGNEGATIKYYCTNSLCNPGRSALMSGKYGHTTGAVNNSTYINSAGITLPKTLNDNGYFTALIGKWMQISSMVSTRYCFKFRFCFEY